MYLEYITLGEVWELGSYYVEWDFNGKNTSHLHFFQKLFIHDVCKLFSEKKNEKKIYVGGMRYFH